MDMAQSAHTEHRRRSPRGDEISRPVGDQLKVVFGELAREPMPDRLRELAQALEDALQRGELGPGARRSKAC